MDTLSPELSRSYSPVLYDALAPAGQVGGTPSTVQVSPLFLALDAAAIAISTYHGYKRNESIGWALWWGLMGGLFPIVTPVIAFAQGYAKPSGRPRLTHRRRRRA